MFWKKVLYIVATSLSKITLNSILQLLQTECNLSPAMHVWIDLFLNIMQSTWRGARVWSRIIDQKSLYFAQFAFFSFLSTFFDYSLKNPTSHRISVWKPAINAMNLDKCLQNDLMHWIIEQQIITFPHAPSKPERNKRKKKKNSGVVSEMHMSFSSNSIVRITHLNIAV